MNLLIEGRCIGLVKVWPPSFDSLAEEILWVLRHLQLPTRKDALTAELGDISPRLDILDNNSDVMNNLESSVLSTGKTVSAALAMVGGAIAHGRSQDKSDFGGPSLGDRRLVEDWIPELKSIMEGAEPVEGHNEPREYS